MGEAYSVILGLPIPDDPVERTYAEGIAQKVAEMALRGNMYAVGEITDRTEGKPTQKNEHSGPGGGPIPLHIDDVVLKVYGNSDDTGNTSNPA
jgi:hypothetical protein